MDIIKVKIQENGYLVNDSIHVPDDSANRHNLEVMEWIAAGNLPEPYKTDEELAIEAEEEAVLIAEEAKANALASLVVTTSTGKVFYADSDSRQDLADAISASEYMGQDSTMWKLAKEFEGSKIVSVTIDEIKEASVLALQAKANLIGVM